MRAKSLRVKLALIVASIAVGGCQAVPPATAPGITLEVWTHEFPPLQTALSEKWIPEFEAANPDVTVNLTSIPFAGVIAYDTKLLSALAGGTGPDVWTMGDWNYPTFKENGFLAPLDPAVFGYASDQEFIDSFLPGTTSLLEHDGRLVGLFSEFNTLNLFYNRDLFREIGQDDLPTDRPLSWSEIGQIGQRLRVEEDGILKRIGLQLGFFANFRSPQWYAMHFYKFMRQYGQHDVFVDGAPAANTQAVVNAFQLIADLQYKYGAYDPTFLIDWFADVPNHRAGMVLAGTWYPAAALGNNPDFDFGVAPMPVVDPNDRATYRNVAWLWGWSVNAASPDAEQAAAQKFLAFMRGKKGETEQAAYWFENLGYFHPRRDFIASEAYAAAVEESPWLRLWITAFEDYEIDFVPHSYDAVGAAIIRAIDRVIYDGASAEDAANQLQAELERGP